MLSVWGFAEEPVMRCRAQQIKVGNEHHPSPVLENPAYDGTFSFVESYLLTDAFFPLLFLRLSHCADPEQTSEFSYSMQLWLLEDRIEGINQMAKIEA